MNGMNDMMKGILSRVLSQEIAHQQIWRDKEREKYGENKIDRDGIVADIKKFMSENEIEFDYEFYIREF